MNPYLKPFVDRFLTAPLPKSVRADDCATSPMAGRSGTNLLTAAEADAVLEHVMGDVVSALWHCWTMTSPGCTASPEEIRKSIQERCNAILNPPAPKA